ncbi:hypothetical protein SBADM41S_05405 [Streptomyces badius]
MKTMVRPFAGVAGTTSLLHLAADQRVQRAERLVEEEDGGVDGERAGEPDALLLAAGELRGAAVLKPGETDLGHGLGPWRDVSAALLRPWISRRR